jgi:hypothetical protein
MRVPDTGRCGFGAYRGDLISPCPVTIWQLLDSLKRARWKLFLNGCSRPKSASFDYWNASADGLEAAATAVERSASKQNFGWKIDGIVPNTPQVC